MNQQLRQYKQRYQEYWNSVSQKRKVVFIAAFLSIITILSLSIYFLTKTDYVPLYSNEMGPKEIGDIKAALDKEGYTKYKLDHNGTKILVPQEDAADLVVSMAAKGMPKTGSISFFDMTKDLQFGATDRQLDAMEREALQGEVSNLLRHVDGVKNAAVVISTPEESLFIREDQKKPSSASVVIEMEPGYQLEQQQIETLYHLVSKSVPNLDKENIVMTDQDGRGLTIQNETAGALNNYEMQRKIQKDIETDIQADLQQLLGTIIGQNKVLIQTYVRLNFDQVKTQENLVQSADPSAKEGIAVSVEEISKKYSGRDAVSETTGTGQTDIPGYASPNGEQENTSEELEKRVNYEVNRISNEIVQSPYKIEDITINVGVEPPDPANPESLTLVTQQSIQQILSNVVRTALSDNSILSEDDISSRITVFAREFSGKAELPQAEEKGFGFPLWALYVLAAAAVLAVLLSIYLVKRRNKHEFEENDPFSEVQTAQLEVAGTVEDEKVVIKKQVEEMAKEQPEEFVGLLRNWLSRD
ncbi:flagellar M-ring protein FliF [Neobacillus notoginsengisoli]|uniref:Flagellar M-ring protein n=1 Tax=Neobacillus notoginsengisoli TaxID=1578198 RepID=A0A417YJQ6_9BACI|nr:flagellar basal-body MS-ring/collar protein FliF [Neobacillus notoginsengisoli]RHW33309.1 flagellar M-ring protein FliF [Neobacillus notoginsengisoli]